MAHSHGAHELVLDAHADVATLPFSLSVLADVSLLPLYYFSFAFADGVTPSHGAHILAVDAHASVAALHLDLFVVAKAPFFGFFGACLKRSQIGEASLERAKPLAAVAHAPIAVDLVGASVGATLDLVVLASIETFPDVASLNA